MTMDMTSSHPRRPSSSFLNHSREIKDSTYYLSPRGPRKVRPAGKLSSFYELLGHIRQKDLCISKQITFFDVDTLLEKLAFKLLNAEIFLQSLRDEQQVHEEAIETL